MGLPTGPSRHPDRRGQRGERRCRAGSVLDGPRHRGTPPFHGPARLARRSHRRRGADGREQGARWVRPCPGDGRGPLGRGGRSVASFPSARAPASNLRYRAPLRRPMVIAAAILWPVAAAMSYIIAALVTWAARARTRLTAAVVLFLLVMMVAMF